MAQSGSHFDRLLQHHLQERQAAHLLRSRRTVKPIDAVHVEIDGRHCVNFCSNNYLGLTRHPKIRLAVEEAIRTHGVGSGAAGLITGHSDLHASAEVAIAQWKKTQSSVLLSSGYQANHAAIQTLARMSRQLMQRQVHITPVSSETGAGLFLCRDGVKK